MLSIAFAVLFVGLGVDFGIQYSVRYRSERFKSDDLRSWRSEGGRTFRRAAVAGGNGHGRRFSVLSADRLQRHFRARRNRRRGHARGLHFQHHPVAGLLDLLNPPGESEPVGYAFLAPVDHFLEKHRVIIIVGTLLVALAGLPLLYFLRFDFNPINLRSSKVESIATFLDLRKDPNTGANAVNVMTNSEVEAKKIKERLAGVPEVLRAVSLDDFVPEDQPSEIEADRARRKGSRSCAQSGLRSTLLRPTRRMSKLHRDRCRPCARSRAPHKAPVHWRPGAWPTH